MKKFVRKTAATTLLAAGIFSAAPLAFGAPPKVENEAEATCIYNFEPLRTHSNGRLCVSPYKQPYIAQKRTYGEFVFTFPENVERMIYYKDSFNKYDFRKVMTANKIIDKHEKYNRKWDRRLEINAGGPRNGCHVVFSCDDKEILFFFDPCVDQGFTSIKDYNRFMNHYKLKEAIIPLGSETLAANSKA